MAKKRIKKTDAPAEPAVITEAAPEVIEAPKKKTRKKADEPTQKEVDEGVAQMEEEMEQARAKALYLHGKVKAGFAFIGLAAAIQKAGGSANAAMTAINALHDDWIQAAMQAIHDFECGYGMSLDIPCDECGGPTCEEHDTDEDDFEDE